VGLLQIPRAWHSATLLADGSVLIIGGRSDAAAIETAELFNPGTGSFGLSRGTLYREL
jgi:hypothetical protein